MAYAPVPPVGGLAEALKRREMLRREQTSIDPVERYKLREERIQRGLVTASDAMIAQARETAKIIKNNNKER